MLAGRGGAGKSTLARWLLRRAAQAGCAIAEGKCEQLGAEIPFAAVAQVVRMLTLGALGGEQVALDGLAERWLAALNGYGNAVVELVTEVRHVIGEQGPTPDPLTSQSRGTSEYALVRTLEAFALPGRPAVVFLDDLQWADDATLSFLRLLIADPPSNVLLVGAYRDDDDRFSTWYAQARHAARSGTANIAELTLAPLGASAIEGLVADTLGGAVQERYRLAGILCEKTGGNPYFAQQLVRAWVEDGVLWWAGGEWQWARDAVELAAYADHVVDLIIRRIDRLPDGAKFVLQQLACIGGQCDAALLASLCDMDASALRAVNVQLAGAGLLVARGESWAFRHDRVFEAAYALIDNRDRSAAHACIVARMMRYWGERAASAAYEIGSQIEKIAVADVAHADRPDYVRILNVAARCAQRASVIDRAYNYNRTAQLLVDPRWWETAFDLAYDVALIECECLIAMGRLAEASKRMDALLALRLPREKRAPLHRLEAVLHTLQSDYEHAIDAATAGLALIGIDLRREPGPAAMHDAHAQVQAALGARRIADLADLPPCEDEDTRLAMSLLSTLISSFFTSDGIRFTHLAKLVELTLRYGVTADSPYGMAWYGVMIASLYEEYADGYAYGVAGLALVDRHGFESTRISTLVALDQVAVWTQPLDVALGYVQQASNRGKLSGDIGMECYACNHIVSDMLAMGAALPLVEEAAEYGIGLTRSIGYRDIELLIEAQMDFAARMAAGYPSGSEARWRQACDERIAAATSLPTKFWASLYAGMGEALLQRWDGALRFLQPAMALRWTAPAHINVADCLLFHAFAVSRSGAETTAERRHVVAEACARFDAWAANNDRTFRNKHQLLLGELARCDGDALKALMHFETSARSAHAAGFVHERAFAHELAAELCREHGLGIAESQHLVHARAAYVRWGAEYKAASLHVPRPLPDQGEPADAPFVDASALQFGLKTVQVLSESSVREKLVETMFSDLLEHADAQYGVLVRVADGSPMIEASGRRTQDGTLTSVALVAPDASIVPMKLLNMALRTRKPVVIHDAANEMAHLRLHRQDAAMARSVVCLPLLRAEELTGLLYLENNRMAGAFNPAQVQRLELMASQMAVALGFAGLYEQLIAANEAKTQAENNLHLARAELVRNSHVTVLANLAASIAHEINQPLGAIVISAQASLRWLGREEPHLARVEEGLHRIKTDGLRAAEIIRAIRGLAKKQAAQLEEVPIAEIVLSVASMISAELEAHAIFLNLQLEPDLVVVGDRIQLQQVILNLMNNAVDAMRESTKDVDFELGVATTLVDGRLQLVVQDNGPGISCADMEHIFEPFYTTKGSGLGMGLAICASVAEAHGGILQAFNRNSGGTRFILDIPGFKKTN